MSQSMMAGGNVAPSRFVKLDTTYPGYVTAAGAGDRPYGVSQPGTRQPPIEGLDDGYAGVQGVNSIEVFTAEDQCWLEVGAAVSVGDYLKPSTNGVGITASADGDIYGAIALAPATASGQLIRVRVLAPSYRAA